MAVHIACPQKGERVLKELQLLHFQYQQCAKQSLAEGEGMQL